MGNWAEKKVLKHLFQCYYLDHTPHTAQLSAVYIEPGQALPKSSVIVDEYAFASTDTQHNAILITANRMSAKTDTCIPVSVLSALPGRAVPTCFLSGARQCTRSLESASRCWQSQPVGTEWGVLLWEPAIYRDWVYVQGHEQIVEH